jgi:radical SAM superfamily enzyme YgiQ (UPF0313 family)
MNILLVQHSRENTEAYPLGLGYVAAVLCEAGHQVHFLDLALEKDDGFTTLSQLIREKCIQALGFTVITPQYNELVTLVEKIKPGLQEVPIVVGGPHASALPEEVLRDGIADVVVMSEGETIAPKVFRTLEEGGDLSSVPGIAFLDSEREFIKTDHCEYISDLDTIPYPPWHIFHPEKYGGLIRGKKTSILLTSRGCPYRCIHCYRGPSGGSRHRIRSIENILEEIRRLYKNHSIRAFGFRDDIFTLDMDRTREFCDTLYSQRFKILWSCQTRVDRIDLDLLNKMKRSGCVCIDFGVESGSEDIQKKLRKKETKEQARSAFKYCREVGISTRAFFMIGTPWETSQTIEETISFAQELNASITQFFLATPYPGTELREEFVKAGWSIPDDYTKYRHFIEPQNFVDSSEDSSKKNTREFFASECRRATRQIIFSQIRDIWHYPELLQAYLRMYSLREFGSLVGRRLKRVV